MSEVTSEWSAKIAAWRHSGQSIAAWCRENAEGYHRFLYWRQRLKELDLGKPGTFVELHPASTPIALECNGVYLHVSAGFDASLLGDILALLKRV
jgi:hypothetical protein